MVTVRSLIIVNGRSLVNTFRGLVLPVSSSLIQPAEPPAILPDSRFKGDTPDMYGIINESDVCRVIRFFVAGNPAARSIVSNINRRMLFEKEQITGDCGLTGRFARNRTNLPPDGN